jgi:hypothetical protein
VSDRLRRGVRRLVGSDDPGSLAGRARARRMQQFVRRFPDLAEMQIVDLGGTPRFWRAAPLRPARLTIVNLMPEPADESWIDSRVGDATEPLDQHFDLVFSNSLIEHLPGQRRHRFAEIVENAAPRHWIQTPNRHFPIEPHWLFPGAQYLPRSARRRLAYSWPASNFGEMPEEMLESEVQNIDLLTASSLAALFPDSEIWRERFGPLTKSLVALKLG